MGRPELPRGLERMLFRLPVYAYRWGAGWMLGGRFVLIEHVGRVSGLPRQTVVEVVARQASSVVVCSGFGTRAQWYRNLRARPQAAIRLGAYGGPARAVFLEPDEGAEIMAAYARLHPRAARALCRFMGYGNEDFREVGRKLPFVRLEAVPG